MANEFLTVRQAQYLLEKWKSEADDTYVAKAGDTMTGELVLGGGLGITSASASTAPPYFLCLTNAPSSGGDVGYVTKANMLSAIGGVSCGLGSVTPANVSCANATDTTLCNTGALTAGLYILQGIGYFTTTSTTGRRALFFATTNTGSAPDRFSQIWVPPASGAGTRIEIVTILRIASTTTYYLRAYQNSGSAMNVQGGIRYLKFSEV